MRRRSTIEIYDSTLRDGTQAEGVSFSRQDKVLLAKRLDAAGIDYIEGGWPGSNPKDVEFFEAMKKTRLRSAKLCAFGSTAHPKFTPAKDPNLRCLATSGVKVTTIFGKSWDLHVEKALRITLERNLKLIRDSVRFLASRGLRVIYDAEHFFDGYRSRPDYAMETLRVAVAGGASLVCLCDTRGGGLPDDVGEVTDRVVESLSIPVGIHAHNDGGLGVAVTLAAVRAGAVHVQGTINGYGERCGNADLCQIVPNLQLKMGYPCLPPAKLAELTDLSHFVSEMANLPHASRTPFVGASAFAHKGGIHVSAVSRDARTYEHVRPELVGNHRRVLVSELAGKSNVLEKMRGRLTHAEKDTVLARRIAAKIKDLENRGYEFEAAEGSFDLLVEKAAGRYSPKFRLEGFRVIVEKRGEGDPLSEATIKVVVDGKEEITAAEGNGPVDALDRAFRKVLNRFYPEVRQLHLADYKVRIIDGRAGSSAVTRVLIESTDGKDTYGTVGVSANIIEASWSALVDSIEYFLARRSREKKRAATRGRKKK